jgi:hypothetical protein
VGSHTVTPPFEVYQFAWVLAQLVGLQEMIVEAAPPGLL